MEFVRTQRQNAAAVLAVLAVVFLACGVFLALRAFKTTTVAADKPLTEEKADPFKLPDQPKLEVENLEKLNYTVGWLACLLAFLIAGAGSAWLMGRLPAPSEADQRTEARVFLLSIGMGLGSLLILSGLAMFYRWNEHLTKWLDNNETHELRYVIIPLMMIVLGAGLIFAAIQPARGDERNNSTVRQVVYGANFLLTALLLLVAFVVFNVVVAVKVPNRLDTTETGFYDLSDRTRQLLGELKEPITVYMVTTEDGTRHLDDMRQLLLAFQEAGKGKVRVKFLDVMSNRQEFTTLRGKFPQLELVLAQPNVSAAVVLAAGEDEKRHAVVPDNEFITVQDRRASTFQGESRLYRELVILADTDTKPVVYFTQSSGEMSIDPSAEGPDEQKLTRLRAYLEKNYLEVRPLKFSLENPTVPADAAVVVVAEPRIPLSAAAAGAIKKYVTDPAKKGRLLVLAGVVPGPSNRGVMKTGLEEVLAELNVGLGQQFVYSAPRQRNDDVTTSIAAFTIDAVRARNEVAMAIAKASPALAMSLPREILPLTTNPAYQALPLLDSRGVTWLEDDRIPLTRIEDALMALDGNPERQAAKKLTEGRRPLAVLVSHAGGAPGSATPAVAVYGNAFFVSDEIGKQVSPDTAPVAFVLVAVTIDWLRGRPSIAINELEGKKYARYQFPLPAAVDTTRLEYLPIGLTLLSITGLGVGVWFVRRR